MDPAPEVPEAPIEIPPPPPAPETVDPPPPPSVDVPTVADMEDEPGLPMGDEELPSPPPPDSGSDDSESEEEDDVEEPGPPAPISIPTEGPVSSGTPAVDATPSTFAPSLPIPVPVLRGVVSVNAAGQGTINGQWTMSETDTVSSAFSFTRRAGDAAVAAPASSPAGDAAVEARPSPDPLLSGVYDGYFMMKRLNLPEIRIQELGAVFEFRALGEGEVVSIPGVSTALQPGDLFVFGQGSNDFGKFELRGRYCPGTHEVVLGKVCCSCVCVCACMCSSLTRVRVLFLCRRMCPCPSSPWCPHGRAVAGLRRLKRLCRRNP